ncbi:MAG: Fic family protein [Bacteroidetes bacterium]|nr:Fic family protein [Bacteroidota bacterium]
MSFDNLYRKFIESGIQESINYDKFNRYLITHHSSSIEGSTLTVVETNLLLDEGITPKGKPLEHSLMVKDYYDALTFVLSKARNRKPITPKFIREIASCVNKNTGKVNNTALGHFDDSKGDYRLTSVTAGNEYFVAYDKVPGQVQEMCDSLNKHLPGKKTPERVYQLSFDAHYYLVTIHPFGDGNGRTSRLLMNYIQAYHKQPLGLVFSEDKADYIEALKATRSSGNLSSVRKFMMDQLTKYFKNEIAQFKKKDRGLSFSF